MVNTYLLLLKFGFSQNFLIYEFKQTNNIISEKKSSSFYILRFKLKMFEIISVVLYVL